MDDDRLINLLGAQALALADRLGAASAPAALVHLCAYPGTSPGALRTVLGITDSGATRLVDRLVAAGLAERTAGGDGRSIAVHPTEAGRAAADEALGRRRAALARALEPLDGAERARLETLLDKVVAGLADDRPGALVVCRLCDRDACCAEPGCPLDHTVAPDG
jgi:DNA-binding MarR family transcriptional regulator